MNEQVMVIDDEPPVLQSLLRALEIEDITCIGVEDPKTAVDVFKASPADVVVVDFFYEGVPEITGLDLIAEIQKIKPLTKAILISGYIDHEKLDEEGLEKELQAKVRCDYYLQKSGDRDELISTVKKALSDVQAAATDWKSIAKEYADKGTVNIENVRQMNESIKDNIVVSTHEEREEE
jgi:two-component system, response regulator YesN